MSIFAIQNLYNGEQVNMVVTNTWGSYSSALKFLKTFAGRVQENYETDIENDYDASIYAPENLQINFFNVACYDACDGVYEGDTRTQAYLQSISRTAEEHETVPFTDEYVSFVWTREIQDRLMDDVDDDDRAKGMTINWYIEDSVIDLDKTTVDLTLCYEFTRKHDWLWEHSDADYEELPVEENGYKEVPLRRILDGTHSSYYEWRYDRPNSPIAREK